MVAFIALAGALLGAQLAQASPVYGSNETTPAGGVVYTTEVVDVYTTYCPAATTLTYNHKTYTVTKPTTLTITDCPCTISKPVKPVKPTSAPPAVTTPPGGVHYTTEVVTELTTYCPSPTTLTYNNVTYTVTKPTTLTVTNCPCSITKPIVYTTEVVTKLTTYCPSPTTLTYNNVTYTVSTPTTLTVTNCPCTITKPTTLPSYTAPAGAGSSSSGAYVPPAAGTTTAPGSAGTTPASVPTAAAGRTLPEYLFLALGAFALF